MSEDVTIDSGQNALDRIGFQPDVLEILRRGPSLSIDDIDGIDASIEALTSSMLERFELFTSEKITLEHTGIDVFDMSLKTQMDQETLLTARIDGDDEEFLAAVTIAPSIFRVLLALTLCGDIEKADVTEPVTLSLAERRMFTRFADQLMAGHFETVSNNPELQIPRQPNLIKDDELVELAFIGQLIRLSYSFTFKEASYQFFVLVSQSMMDNEDDSEFDEESNGLSAEASEEASWKKAMMGAVEHLGIPFNAQLADAERPLTYISSLKVGEILDVELDLDQVKIVDDEGQLAFVARIEIQNDEITIRATGSAKNPGK